MPRRPKAPTGPLPGTAAALRGVIDFSVDRWGHPLGLPDDPPLPLFRDYAADFEVKRRFLRFVEDGKVVLAGRDVAAALLDTEADGTADADADADAGDAGSADASAADASAADNRRLTRFEPAELGLWDFDLLRETATPARGAPRGTPPKEWLLPLSPAAWARAAGLPARAARKARHRATPSYTVVVAWALLQADVALEERGHRQKLDALREANVRAYGFDPAVFDEALGVLPRGLKLGVGKKR